MHEPAMIPPSPTQERYAWRNRVRARAHRVGELLLHRWWVLAVTVALGLAAGIVVARHDNVLYVSTGRMIVNLKLSIPEGSLYTEELNNFLGTQAALMQSEEVLSRAQIRTQPPTLEFPPVSLKVFIQPKTTIFLLQGTGENGPWTRQFVQACMEEYITFKKEMRTQTSDTTVAGMAEEIARLETELRRCDSELVAFQSTNSVVLLQEQGNSAGNYLAGLNQRLAGLKSERKLLQGVEPDQVLAQARSLPLTADTSLGERSEFERAGVPETDYLRTSQQALLLKAELEDLAKSLRPKHPRIMALQEEIARRERLLEIFRGQIAQQLASRKQLLDLQIATLEKEVLDWDTRALQISWRSAEFQRLKSNAQRTQTLYDRLLATMQTLDLNRQISPESVTIMEKASAPIPQKAPVGHRLLAGAAAGLLAGILFLGFIDRLDDRIISSADVRELFTEDVLGQIPREELGPRAGSGLLRTHDERYAWVEAYRHLRSALLYLSAPSQRPRTVLVTSSVPGEGKSVTAANLAITLARGGAKVLLIDADVRKGVLHQLFETGSCAPGFADLLSQPGSREAACAHSSGIKPISEAATVGLAASLHTASPVTNEVPNPRWTTWVRTTPVSNLTFLPCGSQHETSEELFSDSLDAFLNQAAHEYEFVILDTPPVMAADDAPSLAARVDGVLFVVRAAYSSARVVRAALDLLNMRNARVLGLVLNAVRPGNADYEYPYQDYHRPTPGD